MHNFSNMANSDLQETGPNKVKLVFNILAYSVITRHIQEVSITAHSETCVNLVYSEPWYIQNPGIFRTMTYLETWHIQNTGISSTVTYSESWHNAGAFKTLVYTEPWHAYNQSDIQNPGIFRISSILTTLRNLCDRALYEYNANSFLHYFLNMASCNLSETDRNKVELVLNILAYSNIIKHFQELSRDIQTHSEACVTLVYSESEPYPEHWYIQDLNEYSQLCQASAIKCFTKIMKIIFCFIFKYGKLRP